MLNQQKNYYWEGISLSDRVSLHYIQILMKTMRPSISDRVSLHLRHDTYKYPIGRKKFEHPMKIRSQ